VIDQLTEEEIKATLTALLAPLLVNVTLKVIPRQLTAIHGAANVILDTTVKGKKFRTAVHIRYTVDGNAVLLSDRDKFISDAAAALGMAFVA
jgi:hypothetical protein